MAAETDGRRLAWVTLLVLTAAFVTVVALVTPWGVPGSDAPRPAPEEFFTDGQIARSEAFHDEIRWPSRLALVSGLVVVALLGFSSVGRRLVTWTRRRVHRWWLQVLMLVIAVSVVQLVVGLPFSIWVRSITREYGLATNSWAEWMVDVAKSWGITLALTSVAVLSLVALARRYPERWFVPAAGGAALVVVSLSFLYPIAFEPVFNKFTSMPDGFLRDRLIQLAEDDGIEVSDVLIADASRRTTTLNAYVSGFGATKRIVVYDNLVSGAPADEVGMVVAHELSHAKYDDVLKGTLEGAMGAGIAVITLSLVLRSERVRRPLRARSAGDAAVVPVVLALAAFGGLVAAPVQSTLSRQVEARADAHALELTGDPETFIDIQQRLAITNIANFDPNPVLSFWFDSHPTTLDRIGMALVFPFDESVDSRESRSR